MLAGLLIVMAGALLAGLVLGWLVVRVWRRGPVLGAAGMLALLSGLALLWVGQGDLRDSMQAAILGFGGMAAAAGLLVGGLLPQR